MREHHAEFGLFKDQDFSPASLACCRSDVIIHDEIIKSDDLCPNDSPMFDNVSIKGLLLDYTKVGFRAYLPPFIAKDELSAINKDSWSDCCKFS